MTLFIMCGCNENNSDDKLNTKVASEIEFFDSKIVDMLNNLNNISFQNYRLTTKKVQLTEQSENTEASGGQTAGSGQQNSGTQSQDNGQQSSQSESKTETSDTSIETTEMIAGNILTNNQEDINWNLVKTEIELINTSWSVILYDLYKINNSNNTDFLAFSDTLDKCILSIKDENKGDSLKKLAELYSYIPKFTEITSEDKNIKNIKDTKSSIIKAYVSASNDEWTAVRDNLLTAEESLNNIFKDIEFVKNNEYKINKTYILLKELQNSLVEQDKSIFYMKYINLMESINML